MLSDCDGFVARVELCETRVALAFNPGYEFPGHEFLRGGGIAARALRVEREHLLRPGHAFHRVAAEAEPLAAMGIAATHAPTLMKNAADRERVARSVLQLARDLRELRVGA